MSARAPLALIICGALACAPRPVRVAPAQTDSAQGPPSKAFPSFEKGWVITGKAVPPIPPLPGSGRSLPAVVAFKGKLFVLGGFDSGGFTSNKVDVYDPEQKAWIDGIPLPGPMATQGAAVLGDRLFVAGAVDSTRAASTRVYSTDGASWREETPLPSGRSGVALVAYRGRLYVIGGRADDGRDLADVLRYEPKTRKWASASPLPAPRSAAAAVDFDGKLLVIGGAPVERMREVLEYDADKDTWIRREPLHHGRFHPAVGAYRNILVVAGGERPDELEDQVETFDPGRNRWAYFSPLPRERGGAGGAWLDGVFYVVGGRTPNGMEKEVDTAAYPSMIWSYRKSAPRSWTTAAMEAAGVETYHALPGEQTRVMTTEELGAHLPPLTSARIGAAFASMEKKLFVMGGHAGRALERVDMFDTGSRKWEVGQNLPVPLERAGAAVVGGRIYLGGGVAANGRKVAEVYSWDGLRWRTETSLPTPRSDLAFVASRGELFAIGGSDESDASLADFLQYDLHSHLWRRLNPLPEPRSNAGATGINERLFVAGGLPEARMADLLEYNFTQGQWLRRAPLNVGRHSAMVSVDGMYVMVAGGTSRAGIESSVELYNPEKDSWMMGPSLQTPRSGGGGLIDRKVAWVVGGQAPDGPLESIESYGGGRWWAGPRTLRSAQPVAAAPQDSNQNLPAVTGPGRALRPTHPRDFALVVGVEQYRSLPSADFAERDAAMMAAYASALGVPNDNVIVLKGAQASRSDLDRYLDEWLPRNVDEQSRLFVFFSGHGAPDPNNGEAFLVPWDGDPGFLQTSAYPVRRLLSKLGSLKAKEIIVALDACFSGSGGRSVIAKGLRPLVNVQDPIQRSPKNITVFTASAADQVSGSDPTHGHGLFTYYLSRGLSGEADSDHDGHLAIAELDRFVRENVQRAARRQNREQSTQLRTSDRALRIY